MAERYGRYVVVEQIESAGHHAIFRAIDERDGSAAALKVLAGGMTPAHAARFGREVALLSDLSHPGIVRFLGHGFTSRGEAYLATEWLEGETLESKLIEGPLSSMGTARMAIRILDALAAVHARGVVHRDVKPGNIFLLAGGVHEPRLLDFGLARYVAPQKKITEVGFTVGTPLYFAPEQARGDARLDGRADVFSLGSVLFECLTGERPFKGDSAIEIATRICVGPLPDLRGRPEVPDDMARAIEAMMQRDPVDRLDDAAAKAAFARIVGDVHP